LRKHLYYNDELESDVERVIKVSIFKKTRNTVFMYLSDYKETVEYDEVFEEDYIKKIELSLTVNELKQLKNQISKMKNLSKIKKFTDVSVVFDESDDEPEVISVNLKPTQQRLLENILKEQEYKAKESERKKNLKKLKPLIQEEMKTPKSQLYRKMIIPRVPHQYPDIYQDKPDLTLEEVEAYSRIRPVMAKIDEIKELSSIRKQLINLLEQGGELSQNILREYRRKYREEFDSTHQIHGMRHINQMVQLMYDMFNQSQFSTNLLD